MPQQFPSARWRWTPLLALAGALGMAGLLFMLIPLTQLLDEVAAPDLTVREVSLSPPPPEPPPLPPDEVTPPPAEPEPVPTKLPQPLPQIEIQTLNVALNPGRGDAVAMGIDTSDFKTAAQVTAEIQQLFTFEDLAEAPRLINQPRFRFPSQLARRSIREGKVIVEIDILPNGQARLRRIISTTHPELEEPAREIVRSARFTKPEVNGQAQTVRGRFPLILQN